MESRAATRNKKAKVSVKSSVPLRVWLVVGLVAAVMAALTVSILARDPAVAMKSYWLVSRAAAIAAYLLLTVTVALGLLLSHPRNKDSWQASKTAMPWHQALVPVFLALLGVHLAFTLLDAKSGVLPINVVFPLSAPYRPYAMLFGSLGLGLLLLVLLLAMWPSVFRTAWLKVHRMAPIIWFLAWVHGMFGGSDTANLYDVYLVTGVAIIGLFIWRQWVRPVRAKTNTSSSDAVGG